MVIFIHLMITTNPAQEPNYIGITRWEFLWTESWSSIQSDNTQYSLCTFAHHYSVVIVILFNLFFIIFIHFSYLSYCPLSVVFLCNDVLFYSTLPSTDTVRQTKPSISFSFFRFRDDFLVCLRPIVRVTYFHTSKILRLKHETVGDEW